MATKKQIAAARKAGEITEKEQTLLNAAVDRATRTGSGVSASETARLNQALKQAKTSAVAKGGVTAKQLLGTAKARQDAFGITPGGGSRTDDDTGGKDPLVIIEEMRTEAVRQEKRQNAFDIARGLAEEYGIGDGIVNRLIDMVSNQGYTSEAVRLAIRQTPEYKERFQGLELYKQNFAADIQTGRKAPPPTPQQYIAFEQFYQEVLTRYGLGDLANRNTFAEFIGGDISPMEVQERVEKVYDKIINADDLLKEQLKVSFPNLGTADFARALLTGKTPEDMATQLQRKVSRAGISSEMARFGLGVRQPLAQELETLGVTRDQARKGFGKISDTLEPTKTLARRYQGTDVGIEDELVQEEFMGLQSQRRKKGQEQERATFSARSGAGAGLGRPVAGTI